MVTGIETAGLVLAAFPLIIAALEHYENGIDPAVRFLKWKGELSKATRGLYMGLTVYNQIISLLLGSIIDQEDLCVMIENPSSSDLWKDGYCAKMLRDKLQLAYDPCMSTIEDIKSIIVSLAKCLDIDGADQVTQEGLRAILAANPPLSDSLPFLKRFEFRKRVRFTMKRRIVQQMLRDLDKYNKTLEGFIKRSGQLLGEETYPTQTKVEFIAPVGYIQKNATKLHEVLCRSWCRAYPSHQAGLLLQQRHVRRSKNRRMISRLDGPVCGDSFGLCFVHSLSELRWRDTEFMFVNGDPEQAACVKIVPPDNESEDPRSPSNEVIAQLQEIRDVCLSIESCSYECVGFYLDNAGILRGGHPALIRPRFLNRIFTLRDMLPHLTKIDRYTLSITLTSSLLQLANTPWLGGNWHQNEIAFLKVDDSPRKAVNIRYPYLIKTYSSNTPDNNLSMPKDRSNLLSLAIMLLEINSAKPICYKPSETHDPSAVYQLLKAQKEDGNIPTNFFYAVYYCIKASVNPQTSFQDHRFCTAMETEVLVRLENEKQFLFEDDIYSVIIVHGLTGDREKSWAAGNTTLPWPQVLLPAKIPNVRVLTFGYDAQVAELKGLVSQSRIENHAMNLLTAVAGYRENDDTAFILARQRPEPHLRAILELTCAIAFLGTTHHGSGLATWAAYLARSIGILKHANSKILAVLKEDSEVLARVQDGFHTMIRSREKDGLQPINITCFYEELPLAGIGLVVPFHSAILPGYIPIGIRQNHENMTKFNDVDDPGFIALTGELRRWVKTLSSNQWNAEERACLRSLSYPEIEARHYAIEQPIDNTCTWLFGNRTFMKWDRGTESTGFCNILWIKGKPGSGKSTLMKQAYFHAQNRHQGNPRTVVAAFFFSARGSTLEKSIPGLLRSLLHQILLQARPFLSDFLTKFRQINEFHAPGWTWYVSELLDHVNRIISNSQDYKIILFIDALDECGEEEIREAALLLDKAALAAGCNLKICVSSRHYPNINLTKYTELRLETFNEPDISTFVSSGFRGIDQDTKELAREIITRSNGVFLWAVLVLRKIQAAIDDGESPGRLLALLQSIPNDLQDLIEHNIRSIPDDEFQESLSFNAISQHDKQFEKYLKKRSRGLIEIARVKPGQPPIIQFFHESVREFFHSGSGFKILRCISYSQMVSLGNTHLERACINFLDIKYLPKMDVLDSSQEIWDIQKQFILVCENHPFLEYAAEYLFDHTKATGGSESSLLNSLFHNNNRVYDRWKNFWDMKAVWNNIGARWKNASFMYIASELGLYWYIKPLIVRGYKVDANGGYYGFALQAAAAKGHCSVVVELINCGADISQQGGFYGTALQAAIANGHLEIMQVLFQHALQCGDIIHQETFPPVTRHRIENRLISYENPLSGSPLDCAVSHGYSQIAKFLINHGAEVDNISLLRAIRSRDHKAVDCVLDTIGGNHANLAYPSANVISEILLEAAFCGYENVVRSVLQSVGDFDVKTYDLGRIFMNAVRGGHSDIIQYLLNYCQDLEPSGQALLVAISGGSKRIVEILLQRGVDANATGYYQNRESRTMLFANAIYAASYGGEIEIVKLLLSFGADPNRYWGPGNIALVAAASQGQNTIVELLLDHGANTSAWGKYWDDESHRVWEGIALHAASRGGHHKVMETLSSRMSKGKYQQGHGQIKAAGFIISAEEGAEFVTPIDRLRQERPWETIRGIRDLSPMEYWGIESEFPKYWSFHQSFLPRKIVYSNDYGLLGRTRGIDREIIESPSLVKAYKDLILNAYQDIEIVPKALNYFKEVARFYEIGGPTPTASSFLNALLQALEKEVNHKYWSNCRPSEPMVVYDYPHGAHNIWQAELSGFRDIVKPVFLGPFLLCFKEIFSCPYCNMTHVGFRYDLTLPLHLPIEEDRSTPANNLTYNLVDCLKAFGTERCLLWDCRECGVEREVCMRRELLGIPFVVIIDVQQVGKNLLTFPKKGLKFNPGPDATENALIYELFAVINLNNAGTEGEHYVTFAKGLEDNRWYEFDGMLSWFLLLE
ncbi:hypothetical protein FQN57_001145 [Myotisia sp. PD_48]|nr:hypothetical protein FQN57_001145 [Myotisia sp. PD_48]